MIEILELETLGYRFFVEGDHIAYRFEGKNPEAEIIFPLLSAIYQKRAEAIDFLLKRSEPIDFASHLFDQANKAEADGDLDRWIRLLEAAGLERSKSYAENEYDRRRCPKCPYLGRGPLYEMGGELVLCDVTCLDTEDTHKSGSNPITSPNQAEVQDVSENADDVTDAGT